MIFVGRFTKLAEENYKVKQQGGSLNIRIPSSIRRALKIREGDEYIPFFDEVNSEGEKLYVKFFWK